jgi:UDP-hydrolysing UDP-N-acetyl-D-glucosamine 2-epimerase
MKKFLIYSGSRADYGILKNLIKDLKKNKKINTKFLVGGSHYANKLNYTFHEIKKDKVGINFISKIKLINTSNVEILKFISKSITDYAKILKSQKPDVVIVLGDRYETYALVIAAYFLRIKIAHIHGGELTNGSFDDSIRHSISKLSNYHFVTHKEYKKRLIQLGEEKKNIFLVGSLGVQNFISASKRSRIEIFKRYQIPENKKVVLVTFHPETNSSISIIKQIDILIHSLKFFKNLYFIITYNNMDSGGLYFINKLKALNKKYQNLLLIKSLGSSLYYEFIENVDLVMGNSSSGIIEVPSSKTPTLDIGTRQLGRVKSKSIYSCELKKISIINSIKKILNKKKKNSKNVYYQKNTKEKILKLLLKISKSKNHEVKKFIDLKF